MRCEVDTHSLAAALANAASLYGLTLRECEVLGQLALGHSNRDAAKKLSISEDTIKSHVRHILPKLGAHSRTHAVALVLCPTDVLQLGDTDEAERRVALVA